MIVSFGRLSILAITISFSTISVAQRIKVVDAQIAHLMNNPTRAVDYDFALPGTSEEYEALGKNAIIQFRSSSAIGTELPLKAAYIMFNGVRVPLSRIGSTEKREVSPSGVTETTYTRQTSYYLMPIHLMKLQSKVMVDFRGARTGFEVTSFSSKDTHRSWSSFVRLDEYDEPFDPDVDTVMSVVAREYPGEPISHR